MRHFIFILLGLLFSRSSAPAQDNVGEVRKIDAHADKISNLIISPDGDLALTTSDDFTSRIWEVESGKMLHEFKDHKNFTLAGAFSPNGRLALTGGGLEITKTTGQFTAGKDHDLRLWDVVSGKKLKVLAGHKAPVWSIQFFSDNKRAVSGGGWNNPPTDNNLYIWDVEKGEVLKTLEGHLLWIRIVAVVPGDRQVASCSWDKTIRIWNVETGKEEKVLRDHQDWVMGMAVSRDGRYLLSGGGGPKGGDCDLRLWDIDEGKVVRKLPGHTKRVWGVAFSKDGNRGLSCAADNTVRVWELKDGKEIHRFDGHTDEVRAVAFVLGDRYALSGSHDKTMRLWKLP